MANAEKKRWMGKARIIVAVLVIVLVWLWWQTKRDAGVSLSQWNEDVATLPGSDPDDILVDFHDAASPERIAAIGAAFGIEFQLVSAQADDENLYRAHVAPTRRDQILRELSKLDSVTVAEPDATFYVENPEYFSFDNNETRKNFPNDPMYKYQWHLDKINMPDAWKLEDGEGVVVAVLDTGVAYKDDGRFHEVEDLHGVKIVKPYNFVDDNKEAYDDHGHGTHVAGTIAQATDNKVGVAGVGTKITIMPLKVLAANGGGSVSGIADAIYYAADEGADVINMSLGGPFPSRAMRKAVEYAHKKGVVVVCAAGNNGNKRVGYPAGYPGAIAVSATQFDDSVTFYSNYGPDIDFAAPGGNVREDQNGDGMPDGVLQNTIETGNPKKSGYFGYMGTSMASPHAAGVAALLVGKGIKDPNEVEAILKETARKPKGFTANKHGAGIIDAKAALEKAQTKTGSSRFALVGALLFLLGAGRFKVIASAIISGAGLFVLPLFTTLIPTWLSAPLAGLGAGSSLVGPLFLSAAVPLLAFAFFWGVKRARGILTGVAIGFASYLLFDLMVMQTSLAFIPDALEPVWKSFNICALLGVAWLSSVDKSQ